MGEHVTLSQEKGQRRKREGQGSHEKKDPLRNTSNSEHFWQVLSFLLHLRSSPRLNKLTNSPLEAKFAQPLTANWPRQTSQLLSIITRNGTLTSERPLWLPQSP